MGSKEKINKKTNQTNKKLLCYIKTDSKCVTFPAKAHRLNSLKSGPYRRLKPKIEVSTGFVPEGREGGCARPLAQLLGVHWQTSVAPDLQEHHPDLYLHVHVISCVRVYVQMSPFLQIPPV